MTIPETRARMHRLYPKRRASRRRDDSGARAVSGGADHERHRADAQHRALGEGGGGGGSANAWSCALLGGGGTVDGSASGGSGSGVVPAGARSPTRWTLSGGADLRSSLASARSRCMASSSNQSNEQPSSNVRCSKARRSSIEQVNDCVRVIGDGRAPGGVASRGCRLVGCSSRSFGAGRPTTDEGARLLVVCALHGLRCADKECNAETGVKGNPLGA